MRPLLLALAVAPAVVVSGCGAEKATTPPTLLSADAPAVKASYKREGMTVSLPRAMTVVERKSPGVFRATFGDWYVSGLAYRRKEQLPRSKRDLRAARRRLVAEVRRRDKGFKVVSASTTRAAGSPAVEIVGDQVLEKQRLRTRSLHVYKGRAEYVLEMAAPLAEYRTLDGVFDRVVRSLRVTGKPR